MAKPFQKADDPSSRSFYGAVKLVQGGFGWLSCPDSYARFGKDIYLSKEDATELANDQAAQIDVLYLES